MPRPRFEDVFPTFDVADAYKCTNEEPMLHKRLLAEHQTEPCGSTGCISSGGEVLFSVLLPKCAKDGAIFAVDHSYKSLAVAFLKAIMLDTLGARAMKALLLEKEHKDFVAAAAEAVKELPDALRTRLTFEGTYPSIGHVDLTSLRREWALMSDVALCRARRRLGKVTFIHGDLQDLSKYGQHDCLYASNALEHTNRDSVTPKLQTISPLVREDGLLLMTRSHTGCSSKLTDANWQHLKQIKGTRTSWDHILYRRITPPADASLSVTP